MIVFDAQPHQTIFETVNMPYLSVSTKDSIKITKHKQIINIKHKNANASVEVSKENEEVLHEKYRTPYSPQKSRMRSGHNG